MYFIRFFIHTDRKNDKTVFFQIYSYSKSYPRFFGFPLLLFDNTIVFPSSMHKPSNVALGNFILVYEGNILASILAKENWGGGRSDCPSTKEYQNRVAISAFFENLHQNVKFWILGLSKCLSAIFKIKF